MSKITAEERAAIDAFPEDRVQKVATGKSAYDLEYRWFPSGKTSKFRDEAEGGGSLRAVDSNGNRISQQEMIGRRKKAWWLR